MRELLASDGQLVGAGWCDSRGMEWVSDKWWARREGPGRAGSGTCLSDTLQRNFLLSFYSPVRCCVWVLREKGTSSTAPWRAGLSPGSKGVLVRMNPFKGAGEAAGLRTRRRAQGGAGLGKQGRNDTALGAQWQRKGFRSSCSGRGDPSGLTITQPGSLEDPKSWLCQLVRKRSDAWLHDFVGRQRGPSV